jgi:hypothetical protein
MLITSEEFWTSERKRSSLARRARSAALRSSTSAGERLVRPGEVLADPLAQRQRQGQPHDQDQGAEADQQALGAGPGVQGPVDRVEQPMLLGVEELLDADGQPVGDRQHGRDLGPHVGPARVRPDAGQVPVDQGQVPADLPERLRHLGVAAALPLDLEQLVAEEAARTVTPFRSPLVGWSSIWSSSSTASRWALTRLLFRNDCWPKMAVVRLTLA